MRMRNKPWADDFLKSHPQIVDVDLNQQYKMAEWFEKTNQYTSKLVQVWVGL